ncbi:hypothetical protein [Streptomyces sp. WAC01280]|uniref:hypothetical protein n=1 Tax=Streptomyces sp. WAC01280 TaxID=2487424 RepID=UPI00163C3D1F|nr:hypothetical protein [Streptomyces sp. WAC01280]
MSTLALLVLMLMTLVVMMCLGGLAYLTYRHPQLTAPLSVAGTFAAVFIAVVALVVAR